MFKKTYSFILNKQLKYSLNFYINIFQFLKNKSIFNFYQNYITFYITIFNNINIKSIFLKNSNLFKLTNYLYLISFFYTLLIIDFLIFIFI